MIRTLTYLRPYDFLRGQFFFAFRRFSHDNKRYYMQGRTYNVIVAGQSWGNATILLRTIIASSQAQKILASLTGGLVRSVKGRYCIFMVLEWESHGATANSDDTGRDD